jgi:hypothetical protein
MHADETPHRPIILTFVRYYLPGFRSGGPVRSVSNLVQVLGDDYDFRIVCYDHDKGVPYTNIAPRQWSRVGRRRSTTRRCTR